MKFEFSVPFVNTKEAVYQYIKINNLMTKGHIKEVYVKCYDGFNSIIEENIFLLKENGIDAVLDLEFSHKMDDKWIFENEEKVLKMVQKWMDLGFHKVLLTNTQLMKYLSVQFPKIQIVCSYKQNLSSMKQYINLICGIDSIVSICPTCSVNHNIKFLKNLNHFFSIDVQIVVNNGCKPMCYRTFAHNSWLDAKESEGSMDKFYGRWTSFYQDCFKEYKENFWQNFIMSDMIYPWQLADIFEETGIYNFRLLPPKLSYQLQQNQIANFIAFYFSVLEDFENCKQMPFHIINSYLLHKIQKTSITLDDIRQQIPDITFFMHSKDSCGSICGTLCNKCADKAKEIEAAFSEKELL